LAYRRWVLRVVWVPWVESYGAGLRMSPPMQRELAGMALSKPEEESLWSLVQRGEEE